jgi:hypothetical protein
MVEEYLRHRSTEKCIQKGDRAALKRLLSVLREAEAIAPATQLPFTPHEQIFEAFSRYLREERGLATRSIVHHLPFVRLFLQRPTHRLAGRRALSCACLRRQVRSAVLRHCDRHEVRPALVRYPTIRRCQKTQTCLPPPGTELVSMYSTSCRRATSLATTPLARLSSTIRSFSLVVQRRRRSGPDKSAITVICKSVGKRSHARGRPGSWCSPGAYCFAPSVPTASSFCSGTALD